jgi:hypothetical protein
MAMVLAKHRAREGSVRITVIRKNGTVEDLGVVAYWHRNPLKRLAWRVRKWLGLN